MTTWVNSAAQATTVYASIYEQNYFSLPAATATIRNGYVGFSLVKSLSIHFSHSFSISSNLVPTALPRQFFLFYSISPFSFSLPHLFNRDLRVKFIFKNCKTTVKSFRAVSSKDNNVKCTVTV